MTPNTQCWILDASTLIHALVLDRVPLIIAMRSPVRITMYVYQQEMVHVRAHEETRSTARALVERQTVRIEELTLPDVQRMAEMAFPRRSVGLGELSCAVVAQRLDAGVLCDDHTSRSWIRNNVTVSAWESIEDILIAAAHAYHLDEYALEECESRLANANYRCRVSLKSTYLMQRLMNR